MATQVFIYKPKGVLISEEDFKKIFLEVKYKTFCGVRKEPEDPFFIREQLKLSDQEELEMFFEEDAEVIGLFDINYAANEPPVIEFLEDHFIYCKDMGCFATEGSTTNILFLLKEKIFAGIDIETVYKFILNHLHESKGICFLASDKLEFINDSDKLLKEKGGVFYSTLDFFEERKVVITPPYMGQTRPTNYYQNYQSGNASGSQSNLGDKTTTSKYNYETKRKMIELLSKQMTGSAVYNQDYSVCFGSTKAYLNSLTDDKLDGIMELYRIRVVN